MSNLKPRNNNQPLHLVNEDGSEVIPRILTTSTLNDASNLTYTTAQVLGGLINRDPNGSARTDTLPTASQLISALGGSVSAPVGMSMRLTIRNTADAAETITVDPGAGLTMVGNKTVVQNNMKTFLLVITSSATITVYTLGSQDYSA